MAKKSKKVTFETDHAKMTLDATEILDFVKDLETITGKKSLMKFAKSKAVTQITVFKDIIDHFDKELGPDGKWKPWSGGYSRHMLKEGKAGNRILQDTGFLRQSFIPGDLAGARVGKGSIIWFNKAKTKDGFPYAAHHDEGASDGKDPRSFMWLSNKAMERLGGLLLDFALDPKKVK